MEIKDIESYWKVVDENWRNLTNIIAHTMDVFHAAYEEPGDAKSKPTGRNIMDELEFLKQNKDQKLCRYFSATWCMCSDAYAWSVPSWGVFCDLNSETWVFDEEWEKMLP